MSTSKKRKSEYRKMKDAFEWEEFWWSERKPNELVFWVIPPRPGLRLVD